MTNVPEIPLTQPEKQHGRIFKEIVVEYPSYSTYPEYKGKPYFSIKYTENGQGFIGYGTYKPEVLSEYLKEYFMPSVQPEIIRCKDCEHLQKWRSEESAKKFGQMYECARHVLNCPKPEDFCSRAERKAITKYHDPFGNPIYVYVRVGDKTVAIKADDLQKALDYVTEHGEEYTIEGRSDN